MRRIALSQAVATAWAMGTVGLAGWRSLLADVGLGAGGFRLGDRGDIDDGHAEDVGRHFSPRQAAPARPFCASEPSGERRHADAICIATRRGLRTSGDRRPAGPPGAKRRGSGWRRQRRGDSARRPSATTTITTSAITIVALPPVTMEAGEFVGITDGGGAMGQFHAHGTAPVDRINATGASFGAVLTVRDAAKLGGVSVSTIYRLSRSRQPGASPI
jgi:hypothetical protein